MGEAKIGFVLEANPGQVIDALLKVNTAQEAIIAGMRRMNREGAGFGKVISGILQIAGGFGLATSAVGAMRDAMGLVVKELEDMRRKESEAAKTTADFAKSFAPTIGQWLGAGMIDKAQAGLAGLAKKIPTLTPAGGEAILAAYSRSKTRAVIEPEKELAKGMEVVGLIGPLTYNKEETAQLIGQLEEIMPEKSMEDLADLATGILKRAGHHRDQLEESMKQVHQMTAVGIKPLDAIAIMMTAFGEEQGGRTMTTMAGLVETFKEGVERKPGQILTPEQKIIRETKGMTEEQIYQWMYANPEKVEKVAGSKWVAVAPLFKPGEFEGWKQEGERWQREDEHKKELEAQQKAAWATTTRLEEQAAARKEWLRIKNLAGGTAGFVREKTKETFEAITEIGAFERKWILRGIELRAFAYGMPEVLKGRKLTKDIAGEAIAELETYRERFARRTYVPYPGISMKEQPYPYYNPEAAEAVEGLIRDIKAKMAAEKLMASPTLQAALSVGNVFQELQAQTRILKMIAELSRPDIALRMIGVNTGMID